MHDKLANLPADFDIGALPDEVKNYITSCPPPSLLLPTVHHFALIHAILDGLGDRKLFMEFIRESSRRVLSSQLYRALFSIFSPSMLARGASARWGRVHRGIELDAKILERGCRISLSYPSGLVDEVMSEQYIAVFETVLELSRARNARFVVESRNEIRTTLRGSWD